MPTPDNSTAAENASETTAETKNPLLEMVGDATAGVQDQFAPTEFLRNLEAWFSEKTGLDGYWFWIAELFLLVLLTVTLNFFIKRLLNRARRRAEQSENVWDDALLYAAYKPLPLLIWVLGIGFVLTSAAYRFEPEITSMIHPGVMIGIIGCITWFLTRLVSGLEANMVKRSEQNSDMKLDKSTADAIGKLVRIAIVITASLILLETIGVSVSALLAFGGIGGIAIGFAAKDILANFFGGLMIYLDRPFAVGDWIASPDKQIEGTVEDIGWRTTRVRKFDKRPLYIPNQVFTTAVVENPSRMTNRRIQETIGLRYDDIPQVEAIVAEVNAMLCDHPEIDQTFTSIVSFTAFGPSSLDIFINTYTKTTAGPHYHQVKQDVLFRINKIIDNHGAEMAFPTQTVIMRTEDKISQEKSSKDEKQNEKPLNNA